MIGNHWELNPLNSTTDHECIHQSFTWEMCIRLDRCWNVSTRVDHQFLHFTTEITNFGLKASIVDESRQLKLRAMPPWSFDLKSMMICCSEMINFQCCRAMKCLKSFTKHPEIHRRLVLSIVNPFLAMILLIVRKLRSLPFSLDSRFLLNLAAWHFSTFICYFSLSLPCFFQSL